MKEIRSKLLLKLHDRIVWIVVGCSCLPALLLVAYGMYWSRMDRGILAAKDLESKAFSSSEKVREHFKHVEEDLSLVGQQKTLHALFRAQGDRWYDRQTDKSFASLKTELRVYFKELLEFRPDYEEMTFVSRGGTEIASALRQGDEVYIRHRSGFKRNQEAFFDEIFKLGLGEVYYSEMRNSHQQTPVLTLGQVLFDKRGEKRGVLFIKTRWMGLENFFRDANNVVILNKDRKIIYKRLEDPGVFPSEQFESELVSHGIDSLFVGDKGIKSWDRLNIWGYSKLILNSRGVQTDLLVLLNSAELNNYAVPMSRMKNWMILLLGSLIIVLIVGLSVLKDALRKLYKEIAPLLKSDLAANKLGREIEQSARHMRSQLSEQSSSLKQIKSPVDRVKKITLESEALQVELGSEIEQIENEAEEGKLQLTQMRHFVEQMSLSLDRIRSEFKQYHGENEQIEKSLEDLGQKLVSAEELAFDAKVLAFNVQVEVNKANGNMEGFQTAAKAMEQLSVKTNKLSKELSLFVSERCQNLRERLGKKASDFNTVVDSELDFVRKGEDVTNLCDSTLDKLIERVSELKEKNMNSLSLNKKAIDFSGQALGEINRYTILSERSEEAVSDGVAISESLVTQVKELHRQIALIGMSETQNEVGTTKKISGLQSKVLNDEPNDLPKKSESRHSEAV